MKTQKRFVISGMFKTLKFLGICLILAALSVPAAHAQTPQAAAAVFSRHATESCHAITYSHSVRICE